MKESGPFYLTVIDKPVSSVWYKKSPMGKNTINTIMKNMKENLPLKDLCSKKNLTSNRARKTVVKKLKSSGIPRCEIKNITGHAPAQGLDDCDSGDEQEQQIITRAIVTQLSDTCPPKLCAEQQKNSKKSVVPPYHECRILHSHQSLNMS